MFTIQKGMKISNVQNTFNTAFPFLKLEFFRRQHKTYTGNPQKALLKTEASLGDHLNDRETKDLVVTEDLTTATLEQLFMDHFGLSVQVFRKSGGSWLETTVTDDWTLKKQNEEGLELSIL